MEMARVVVVALQAGVARAAPAVEWAGKCSQEERLAVGPRGAAARVGAATAQASLAAERAAEAWAVGGAEEVEGAQEEEGEEASAASTTD